MSEFGRICSSCFKEAAIIEYIEQDGSESETCSYCKQNSAKTIDAEDENLYNAIRAHVRYHIDEWDYNTHIGGDSILNVIIETKAIFSDLFFKSDQSEEFIDYTLYEAYYDPDKGVSLFYGHDGDGQLAGVLEGIKFQESKRIKSIIQHSQKKDYFELISIVKELVNYVIPYIENHCEDLSLYRARNGYKEKKISADLFDIRPSRYYVPHSNDSIGAPPIEYVSKGRMNREGYSFLYMAEDIDTALHEIRPHPGDFISIGKFTQSKKIKIADFTKIKINDFWNCDNDLEIFEELHWISKFVSNPVGTSEGINYLYTQLICKELMSKGFEGIKFKSSITDKLNYCIFDVKVFSYVSEEQSVIRIDSFKIEYTDQLINDPAV